MRTWIMLAILCTLVTVASGALLGTGTIEGPYGGSSETATHETDIQLSIIPSGASSGPTLFEGIIIDEDDRDTWLAADDTDPDFASFVELLTNGEDDLLVLALPRSNGGITEYWRWESVALDVPDIDLAGTTPDRIEMFIDEIEFVTPNSVGGTSVRAAVTLWFLGESVGVEGASFGSLKASF